jgi:hypothetical protein
MPLTPAQHEYDNNEAVNSYTAHIGTNQNYSKTSPPPIATLDEFWRYTKHYITIYYIC